VRPIIVVILLQLKRFLFMLKRFLSQMLDSERLELLLYLELPVDDMKNGTLLETFDFLSRDTRVVTYRTVWRLETGGS
jgi:hypothetical protein